MRTRDMDRIIEKLDERAEKAAMTASELWRQGENDNSMYYEGMAVAFDEAIALIEAVQKGKWE